MYPAGPGLAVRVLGAIGKKQLDILRHVDEVFINTIREFGLYDEIWQVGWVANRGELLFCNKSTCQTPPCVRMGSIGQHA